MSFGLAADPHVHAVFQRIVGLISSRGQGLSMTQLAAASALAKARVSGDDPRVEELAAVLDIDPEELDTGGAT